MVRAYRLGSADADGARGRMGARQYSDGLSRLESAACVDTLIRHLQKQMRKLVGTLEPQLRLVIERTHQQPEATMAGKTKNLEDLMLATVKDVYHAEKQVLRALKKMAKAAQSDELREALEQHHSETEGQIERLEKIFEIMGKAPRGKTCEAIQGIIAEGEEIMEDFADSDALEAGMVAANQAIEHYEIARYGTLRTWARQLGLDEAVALIEETLEEEKKTDELLTTIAESKINAKAAA
jgi:ferritin-like metal-binding protein YciE